MAQQQPIHPANEINVPLINQPAALLANPPAKAQINNIQVRIPPFLKQNPHLWFPQIESQFQNSNIDNDVTTYHTIVIVIERNVLSAISDIVLNPPQNNLYNTIKTRLLTHFAPITRTPF